MRLKQLQYMLDVYIAAHFHRISLGINLVMVHKLLIFYRVEKNFCNDVKIWFRLLLLICIFNSAWCRFDQIFHVEGWQRTTFAKSEIELELTGRAYPPVDQLIAFLTLPLQLLTTVNLATELYCFVTSPAYHSPFSRIVQNKFSWSSIAMSHPLPWLTFSRIISNKNYLGALLLCHVSPSSSISLTWFQTG